MDPKEGGNRVGGKQVRKGGLVRTVSGEKSIYLGEKLATAEVGWNPPEAMGRSWACLGGIGGPKTTTEEIGKARRQGTGLLEIGCEELILSSVHPPGK